MAKAFEYIKRRIVDFKLDLCCWIVPVRLGLLATAYINIALALLSLIGTTGEGYPPLLMQVQEGLLEDNAKNFPLILAYATELSFSVLVPCAIYRKDIPLLRLYQRYCIAALIGSIMVYSTVVAAVGPLIGMLLIISILFQMYVIILVRSMIVEIKLEKKNIQLPTMVMSTLLAEPPVVKIEPEVVEPSDSDDSDDDTSSDDSSEGDKKERLETVEEHPKEESMSEEAKK